MVKRNVGAKDSGGILPGHGGILDRIDGMMSALPIYAVLLTFVKIV
jgi:phosphatidate cytidylyltransferase